MKHRMKWAFLLGLTMSFTAWGQAPSLADTALVHSLYTKRFVQIPMWDGVKLHTVIYEPRKAGTYPVLLTRTPYGIGPYDGGYKSALGPSRSLMMEGYIFVYQDVRGKYMSEGEYVNMRPHIPKKRKKTDVDESSDTWDTVDWLVKNLRTNGKVGLWGISYPGFYASMALPDAHPAVKAVSPQAPIVDWFTGDDFHHNGALFLPHAFNFLSGFGKARPQPTPEGPSFFKHPTPDGYDFFLKAGSAARLDSLYLKGSVGFWKDLIEHPDYDTFWQARCTRPHFRNVKPAVLVVGGWFDAENLYGALELYQAIRQQSPQTSCRLVMGPWWHGAWARSEGEKLGHIWFGQATAAWYREAVEKPFFNYHLKGLGADTLASMYLFETGKNRWLKLPAWEASKSTPCYPTGEGGLSLGKLPSVSRLSYVSDPAKPVPSNELTMVSMPREYMTEDQRHAARRPDVLSFSTSVLEKDLRLQGPIEVDLWVQSTGSDADFVVKFIDVWPDSAKDEPGNPPHIRLGGYQMLLRGDVFRTRYRESFSQPVPLVPGVPTRLRFRLNAVVHTLKAGHKLMVQVQSTWFPMVDLNPQTFVQNIYKARPQDYRPATQTLLLGGDKASVLYLPVVE